jgi:8-oxo-dGTP pyrophosphatase MutT (NUDIX family)
MSAENLISLLTDYLQTYPQESATVDRYIEFVSNHSDCFERSQLAGHVTGSAWLVNQAGTHVLLTNHRKLNRWLQLGGHADGHTNALEVALKEATEESGIKNIHTLSTALFDVDIHEIPERKNEPAHFHYDARFALQVTDSDSFTVSDESHALAWVPINDLASHTDEVSMLRMADKWQQFKY